MVGGTNSGAPWVVNDEPNEVADVSPRAPRTPMTAIKYKVE